MFAKTFEHHRLQDRVRQSSLPLKKRRFQPIKDISNHAVPLVDLSFTSLSTTPLTSPRPQTTSLLPMLQRPLPVSTSTAASADQRLAALTLIATASADPNALATLLGEQKNMTSPSSLPLLPQRFSIPIRDNEETSNPLTPKYEAEDEGYSSSANHRSNDPGEPLSPAAAAGTTPAGKRIRHRPLLQPLPGGCHGKSSRHNSYCRRMPCYNGSNYCKLHYRQYVLATSSSSDDMTLSAEEDHHQEDPDDETAPFNSPKPRGGKKGVLVPQDASSPNPPHQDRRYMGGPDETRCSATTTRGRACAYVAVRNTKYCHLHADYDTNPPPRRGGCAGGPLHRQKQGKTSSKKGATASAFRRLVDSPRPESRTVSSEDSVSLGTLSSCSEHQHRLLSPTPTTETMCRTTSTTTTKKTTASPSQASRRAVARRKHADSPYPLLSMISTDQWSQKLVRIATGPFKDRTGNVEKWGNGWVSVRIPGVGMHNRRSFELYLHQPETAKNHKTPPSPSLQQQQHVPMCNSTTSEEDGLLLRRCVSRDVRSPPLLVGGASSSSSSIMNGVVTVTPRPVKTVISSNSSTNSNVVNLSFPMHDAPETPVGHSSASSSEATVTPTVQQNSRPETTIPLVESLLLSKREGKKYKLDMLFGTAALERSRRSIQKPTRYEPTDMTTAIKNSKRDRKTLEDGSTTGPESDEKRARLEGAN